MANPEVAHDLEVLMRKLFAMLVAATLVLGVLAGPSAFAGKKKKTRTITLEESGSMAAPAPQSILLFGVTEGEFRVVNECASMPVSQGIDGWVVEVPPEFQLGTASLEVLGADTTGAYDLDVYFLDAGCTVMEPYMQGGVDPSGTILPGAAWIVVDLFAGANATFDLKATVTVTE